MVKLSAGLIKKYHLAFVLVILTTVSIACSPKSQLRFSDKSESSLAASEAFACSEPDSAVPSDIQKLTKYELKNTLTDLFGSTVMAEAKSQFDAVPKDNLIEGFDTIERSVSSNHIQAYFDLANAVARQSVSTNARLSLVAGACILSSTVTATCIENFIRAMGQKIFRRPLASAEISEFKSLYSASAATARDGVEIVLSVMLQWPDFLYRLESLGTETEPSVIELTPFELASKLSYTLWGTSPDTELFQKALEGSIKTESVLRAQYDRLMGSARARQHIKYFYGQWLSLTDAMTASYSPEFLDGIDTAGLPEAMKKELEDFVEHIIWTKKGSVNDLLTSNLSFLTDAKLASVYGVAPSSSGSVPVELPVTERSGILTRAGFVATGEDTTHPFRRGSRVLSRVLCYNPPRPSAEALPPGALDEPADNPLLSTRERFETKTTAPMCMSCHSKINPFSFTLESYDSLGRFRTVEDIRDPETHAILNKVPVNSVVSYIFGSGISQTMSGPVAVSQELASSGDVDICFVRQWYRFARSRDGKAVDNCALKPMHKTLTSSDGSILKMIEASVFQPQFRMRRLVK
jgi:hypothetical protein